MEYRRIGATDMSVSPLSFGASPLGGVFGEVDEREAARAVRCAIDHGINFFDVAPYYGDTRAESVLGRALRGIPRESYLVATKVGRYGLDEFDFSAARVKQSVDESLSRLGIGTIDLIQCHDVEFVDARVILAEALPALRELRREGKVRSIGISGLPLQALRRIVDAAPVDCVLSYCRHTLHDASLAAALPYFDERDVGVINASPLAMGLLTDEGPPTWHPAPEELRAAARRAAERCRRRGVSIAALALRYSVECAGIATTLVGIASAREVAENRSIVAQPLDVELVAEVRTAFGAWRDRIWPSGRPENRDPPPAGDGSVNGLETHSDSA